MNTCAKCGFENADDAKQCTNCLIDLHYAKVNYGKFRGTPEDTVRIGLESKKTRGVPLSEDEITALRTAPEAAKLASQVSTANGRKNMNQSAAVRAGLIGLAAVVSAMVCQVLFFTPPIDPSNSGRSMMEFQQSQESLLPVMVIVWVIVSVIAYFPIKNRLEKQNTEGTIAREQSAAQPAASQQETAVQPTIAASNKSPIVAALLSFFLFGGVGQIYLGQWKKGLVLILATLFLSGFLIGIPIGIIGVGDAYGTAKKLGDGNPVREWEFNVNWKVIGLVVIIYAIAICGIVFLATSNPSR